MNHIVIGPLLRRFGRARLRRIIRGHRRFKAGNQLDRLVRLKDDLTNARLPFRGAPSPWIFGASVGKAETAVRQFLLTRIGGNSLNQALLATVGGGGPLVHPLPGSWRRIVREHGFPVAGFRSALFWYAYVAMRGIHGGQVLLNRVLGGLRRTQRAPFAALGRYVFFDGLAPGNLPAPGVDGRSHDILSWYLRWPGRAPDLDSLAHDVKTVAPSRLAGIAVRALPRPIPPCDGPGDALQLLGWGVIAWARAALDFARGCWWPSLLLAEAVRAREVRLADRARLAQVYLFHNSNWIFRPLWTYEAEARGSRILFYFYSTNCESFKTPSGYPIQANSWQAMSWPHYLVWDQGQADFVLRATGPAATVEVVDSIWFHSSPEGVRDLPPRTVAAFDVQPVRGAFYSTLGLALDYYTPDTAIRFLGDLHDCARSCGASVAFKRKRKIGRLAHPLYRRFVGGLDNSPAFVPIDPDVSALRLIERSAAVVSMPFTSTALIARELNKPSCYYDPTGVVQKDDRAAHGIEVVVGREELERWLRHHLAAAALTIGGKGSLPTRLADGIPACE